MLVGNPLLRFKGFNVALAALERAWEMGSRFRVRWVCQVEPSLGGLRFPVELVVNPPQAEIPRLYATSDLLLFTSWYEGFGLPPLEAMACAIPVVTTDCGGVRAFIKPGENCLSAEPGDIASLAAAVNYLLGNEDARAHLGARGRETALQFDWVNVAQLTEELFLTVASGRDLSRPV